MTTELFESNKQPGITTTEDGEEDQTLTVVVDGKELFSATLQLSETQQPDPIKVFTEFCGHALRSQREFKKLMAIVGNWMTVTARTEPTVEDEILLIDQIEEVELYLTKAKQVLSQQIEERQHGEPTNS